MAISYNTDLLNRYLAPGISEFTTCDAPDIAAAHPEAPHWLANHFLNAVFRGTFKNKYRQYAVNQIFRAQVAFADYHEARNLTAEFLARGKPDNPASHVYFRAVARWESCLLNLQIFIDVMNKMKMDLNDKAVFIDDDGTPEQRAYVMANSVKHWGSDIFASRHAEEDTVPLWLTNSGLRTRLHEITYRELANLVSEVATAAGGLQDPKSFAEAK
jgi:hypothetical protein